MRTALLFVATIAVTHSLVAAPPAKPGASALAVDVVELKGNPASVRGAVLNRTADDIVVVAVSRAWLKATHPAYYETFADEEMDRRTGHLARLATRLDAWIDERVDDARLVEFLKSERERLRRLAVEGKPAPPESQFVMLEFPASRVKKVSLAPPARKQVALVAWQEELTDVETRGVSELEDVLKKTGVDVAAQTVDLTARLASGPESDRQWAARQAVIEYGLRKSLDFQGIGNVLVRTGEGAGKPEMGTIIAELFRSQVQGQLDDLLGDLGGAGGPPKKSPTSSSAKATRTADEEKSRGVRITRVDQNLAARRVTVEEQFLARMPDGAWQTVWAATVIEDASKPRAEAEQRIAKDPQVSSALNVVKSLGLGGDADEAVQTAIRFGAAVMEAQKAADSRYYRFRDAYLPRVDGPPLNWPER